MSRHLFQLARLTLTNAVFFDPVSRSESTARHVTLVAECTDSLQSLVHSFRGDAFLELGAEFNSFTSYAEYDGYEGITMS
jgi:hypothetical protein